jgi:hypothetical protein
MGPNIFSLHRFKNKSRRHCLQYHSGKNTNRNPTIERSNPTTGTGSDKMAKENSVGYSNQVIGSSWYLLPFNLFIHAVQLRYMKNL